MGTTGVRVALLFVIGIVCIAIIVYQRNQRQALLKYTINIVTPTQHVAPTSLEFLQTFATSSQSCGKHCLTALWLVKETKDLLTEYKDNLPKAFELLGQERARLRNPETNEYPFVFERSKLHGDTNYKTLVHGNRGLVNSNLPEMQTMLDTQLCPSRTCQMESVLEAFFNATNLTDKKYATVRYAWYDPVSGNEIFKESILYRFSQHILIGSGYTIKVHKDLPDIPVLATCLAVYASLLIYIFVYPATQFRHTHTQTDSWLMSLWFPMVFMIGAIWLMYRHSNTISIRSSTDRDAIYNQTQTKRLIAGTMAAMALSFTFIQRTYKDSVIKLTLFASIVLSILAFIDFSTGVTRNASEKVRTEETAQLVNYHITSAFVTGAIMLLIWLFTFLVLRTQ